MLVQGGSPRRPAAAPRAAGLRSPEARRGATPAALRTHATPPAPPTPPPCTHAAAAGAGALGGDVALFVDSATNQQLRWDLCKMQLEAGFPGADCS